MFPARTLPFPDNQLITRLGARGAEVEVAASFEGRYMSVFMRVIGFVSFDLLKRSRTFILFLA